MSRSPALTTASLVSCLLNAEFSADAPTDGSIVLMPVFASHMGISPTNPRLSYSVNAFDGSGSAGEAVPGTGYFNAFAPAVSNAMVVPVAPNTTMDVPVAIDRVEFTNTPAIGFMVVTEDNRSGGSEAALLPLDDLRATRRWSQGTDFGAVSFP